MSGTRNSGGHNAKSIEDLKKAGTYRPDRHGDIETPKPPAGRPQPPKTLKGCALTEWVRMVERLEQLKTLSTVDDAVLYQYVQVFEETEAIKVENLRLRKLVKVLMTLSTKKLQGTDLLDAIRKIVDLEHVISRQSTQLKGQHALMRQYLAEMGMTHVSRNRVKIQKGEDRPASKLVSFRGGRAAAPNTETK